MTRPVRTGRRGNTAFAQTIGIAIAGSSLPISIPAFAADPAANIPEPTTAIGPDINLELDVVARALDLARGEIQPSLGATVYQLQRPNSAPAVPAPPRVAAVPPPPPQSPVPSAAVSTQYRSLLAGWLEAHKRYPDSARQRGEEGRAVLRFRVDRSGRVLGFTVIGSTGHADLDAAVEAMMRGATMPAFPAGMAGAEIEATVAIRFSLAR
jgi:TonB family protein